MSLPIQSFIETKIKEYDEDFDLRNGTALNAMLLKPVSLIMQPFRDELDQIQLNQSVKNILESDDPNAFPEDAVDALMSNVFVERQAGSKVTGVVRAYFIEARALDVLDGEARFLDESGNAFINTSSVSITTRQMSIQTSGDYFYVDIPVEAEEEGAISVDVNQIISWENQPSGLVSVGNEEAFSVGADKETNLEFINRAKNSISVRDLVTGKGITATMNENFTSIEDIEAIGFGDPEMQRDIVFNTHVGGHVDIYVKTPQLLASSFDALAVLTDNTRRTHMRTYKSLTADDEISLGIISIDRTDFTPTVKEIASDTAATFTSSVDLASGVNLSSLYNIKLTAVNPSGDVVVQQIGLQGSTPSATTRSEIISKINTAMGFTLCVAEDGGGGEEYIKFTSPIDGPSGYFTFQAPTGADATNLVFGLSQAIYPHIYIGSTAEVYVEGVDYTIDDDGGIIARILTGNIGDGQLVEVELEYNPISIDIGSPVRTVDGTNVYYSIRSGREDYTITEVPLIDITSIEILDPVSGEPTGDILDASGGFGQGGFGQGAFGVGSGSEYRMVITDPHLRYSVREGNYIEISPNYLGRDLRVNYRYAPEIASYQTFVDSVTERVVTAKLIVKHFIPAFIDVSIAYEVPASSVNIKTNAELVNIVAEAINDLPRGQTLQVSDLISLLYDEGATKIDLPITLYMEIINVNGVNEKFSSEDEISVPSRTLDSETNQPLSPRISHFIPRNVELTRRIV